MRLSALPLTPAVVETVTVDPAESATEVQPVVVSNASKTVACVGWGGPVGPGRPREGKGVDAESLSAHVASLMIGQTNRVSFSRCELIV